MDGHDQENKKNLLAEWLEQLQQESWQLELLISGLSLYGLWEAGALITILDQYIAVHRTLDSVLPWDILIFLLRGTWLIFLFNFLIHVILRGLWIGVIGLRYVSGEIDFEELDYSAQFTEFFQRRIGSYDHYIERLEKICSVMFSFAFLLFFMFLSFILTILAPLLVTGLVSRIFGDLGLSGSVLLGVFWILYLLFAFFVFIDFLGLGAFKKVKDPTISRIYFYIYRFYSSITLSFIYRPLLLNFIDNKFTRRLFLLAFPYGALLIFSRFMDLEAFPYFPRYDPIYTYASEVGAHYIHWNHYDDLRRDHLMSYDHSKQHLKREAIRRISIDSYVQQDDRIDLFLRMSRWDQRRMLKSSSGIQKLNRGGYRLRGFSSEQGIVNPVMDSLRQETQSQIQLVRDWYSNEQTGDLPDIHPGLQSIIADHPEMEYEEIRPLLYAYFEGLERQAVKKNLQDIRGFVQGQFVVRLDDREIGLGNGKFFIHPNLRERGFLYSVRIDSLKRGDHFLELTQVIDGEESPTVILPFYKE